MDTRGGEGRGTPQNIWWVSVARFSKPWPDSQTVQVARCHALSPFPCWAIAGFHCHAIKIKIENYSMNEVKKLTRYIRQINKQGLCPSLRSVRFSVLELFDIMFHTNL